MSARLKGGTLLTTMAVVRELNPGPRAEDWVRACPPETQLLLRRTLLAIEWISADLFAPFLQVLLVQACQRDENRFRKLMRVVFGRENNSTYRLTQNTLTAALLIPRLPGIWSSRFDGGTLKAQLSSADEHVRRGVVEIRDFQCESSIYGLVFDAFLEQMVIQVGARNYMVTRTRESHLGGIYNCDYLLTF